MSLFYILLIGILSLFESAWTDIPSLCSDSAREMLLVLDSKLKDARFELKSASNILDVSETTEKINGGSPNPMDQVILEGIVSTWLVTDEPSDRAFLSLTLSRFSSIREKADVSILYRDLLARKTLQMLDIEEEFNGRLSKCIDARLPILTLQRLKLVEKKENLDKLICIRKLNFATLEQTFQSIKNIGPISPTRWIDSKLFTRSRFEFSLLLDSLARAKKQSLILSLIKKVNAFVANLRSIPKIIPETLWNICRPGYLEHVDITRFVDIVSEVESQILDIDTELKRINSLSSPTRFNRSTLESFIITRPSVEWTNPFHW